MKKTLSVLFSVSAYLIFFSTFLYLVAFLTGLPMVPRSIDAGGDVSSAVAAALVDIGLIGLFGLQHSVMARPGFKKMWVRLVPEPLERSVYVLLASCVLVLLFLLWRPISAEIWNVQNEWARYSLWALFAAGWAIVLTSTFLINHFELFGLQQVWLDIREKTAAAPQFRTPLFYRIVRHPLYVGFIIAFWATPRMTAGHALFATGMSLYIVVALIFEERDLVALFGDQYRRYQSQVGKLVPRFGGRSA